MPSENNPKWCFFWKYRKGVVNLHLLKPTACLKIMCVFPLHSPFFSSFFCLTVFLFVTCSAMKWETRHEVQVICKGCTSLSQMHQQTSCTSYIWWSFLQSEFLGFKYYIGLQIWVSTKTTWLWGHKNIKNIVFSEWDHFFVSQILVFICTNAILCFSFCGDLMNLAAIILAAIFILPMYFVCCCCRLAFVQVWIIVWVHFHAKVTVIWLHVY